MTKLSDDERKRILTRERAVNEQYLQAMEALVARSPEVARTAAVPRSTGWVDGAERTTLGRAVIEPVRGRVGLDAEDDLLGTGFYIGPWHQDLDGGAQVVCWAAPIASLFYEGRSSGDPLAAHVVGQRTFEIRAGDLRAFADDLHDGVSPHEAFTEGGGPLAVPAPPTRVARPTSPRPARRAGAGGSASSSTGVPAPPERVDGPRPQVLEAPQAVPPATAGGGPASPPINGSRRANPSPQPPGPRPDRGPRLRAEEIVRRAIAAPRSGHLSGLLGTLQPDQYALVTWPPDRPLIVQGQPGTGKTVIALHRAAWLTNEERVGGALGRVLVVGPTEQYVEHVRHVQREIGSRTGGVVEVRSIEGLMAEIAGLGEPDRLDGPPGHDAVDGSWELGRALDRCALSLRRTGGFDRGDIDPVAKLVDAMVAGQGALATHVRSIPGLEAYLGRLKSYDHARTQRCFLTFLAAARVAARPPATGTQYDHIVVDEAQDVRQLEWRVLDRLLHDGGGLSLFGDMNQRRSDGTFPTWGDLVEAVEVMDGDSLARPRGITTGYRSTRQILRFANQLLPAKQRVVHALRDGPEPVVEKAPATKLPEAAVADAEGLAASHANGLVAIIAMDVGPITRVLRQAGWRRTARGFERDSATILALQPNDARGLEFDGVVVVEPADFPANLGRL